MQVSGTCDALNTSSPLYSFPSIPSAPSPMGCGVKTGDLEQEPQFPGVQQDEESLLLYAQQSPVYLLHRFQGPATEKSNNAFLLLT